MNKQLAILTFGVLGLSSGSLIAGKDAALSKEPGEATLSDAIEGDRLGNKWTVSKGEWRAVDGAIRGRELDADKHAAVLTLAQPNTDSTIRFSFQLDGAKGFNLSFNKARGHLFRVAVAEDGLTITLDKDKKDPKSKVVKLASAKGTFRQGEWYTLLVVVDGENVSVQADNGVKAVARHASIRQPKPNYRFVMRGESLRLDDVKVWLRD